MRKPPALLTCALLLFLMPLARAGGRPPVLDPGFDSHEAGRYQSAAVFKGRLFLSGDDLYAWQPGEGKLRLMRMEGE